MGFSIKYITSAAAYSCTKVSPCICFHFQIIITVDDDVMDVPRDVVAIMHALHTHTH